MLQILKFNRKKFTPLNSCKANLTGFTLVEIIVVMAIITILSTLIFNSYSRSKQQLALQRSATKLAQDIRKAQEMAMAAEDFGGSTPSGGYGIYLRSAVPQSYVLFADINNNQKCDGCDSDSGEFIKRIFFESGIKIKNLDSPDVNIIFKPPDPEVYLKDNNGNDLGSQTSIVICLIGDESKTKTIKVNKAGLIFVE